MAANPLKRPSVPVVRDREPGGELRGERRQFVFSFRQLLLFWLVPLICLPLVFSLGVRSGKKIGAEIALEERSTPMVRLPLTDLSSPQDSVIAPADEAVPTASLGEEKTPGQPDFDFSSARVFRLDPPGKGKKAGEAPGVGFASRGANVGVEDDAVSPGGPVQPESVAGAKKGDGTKPAPQASTVQVPKKLITPGSAAEEPAEETAAAERPAGKTWVVQVAAPDTRAAAGALVARLKRAGINSRIEVKTVKNKSVYRVVTPEFADKKGAEAQKKKILAAKINGSKPFVREGE